MPAAPKTSYRQPKASSSTAPSTSSNFPKRRPTEQRNPDGIPGLSKIKASIRQTKRLLSKETLEPALRVTTQRRLTALEADLANAEKRDVEKKNGAKYHMVKFVERQKLLRLIRRYQKEASSDSSADSARCKRELEDARIMLNYVLHFPNTQKYIALFPASIASETEPRLTLPPILSSPYNTTLNPDTLDAPSKTRLEMLKNTRKMMLAGELSTTPEEGLGNGEEKKVVISSTTEAGGKKNKKADKAADEGGDDFFDVE